MVVVNNDKRIIIKYKIQNVEVRRGTQILVGATRCKVQSEGGRPGFNESVS